MHAQHHVRDIMANGGQPTDQHTVRNVPDDSMRQLAV
jgi:hypothetical protein